MSGILAQKMGLVDGMELASDESCKLSQRLLMLMLLTCRINLVKLDCIRHSAMLFDPLAEARPPAPAVSDVGFY